MKPGAAESLMRESALLSGNRWFSAPQSGVAQILVATSLFPQKTTRGFKPGYQIHA
jgi:hypothetical protein